MKQRFGRGGMTAHGAHNAWRSRSFGYSNVSTQ